jgi:hypothetical protein
MGTGIIWESNEGANGLHIRAEIGNTGLILTLRRRAVMLDNDAPPAAGWFIHSQLMIWWPSPIDEAMRLIGHWLAFYDPSLPATLRPLAEKLVAIPDPPRKGSVPPAGHLPS